MKLFRIAFAVALCLATASAGAFWQSRDSSYNVSIGSAPDTTAPVLSSASGTQTGATTANLSVNTDETTPAPGKMYWVVVPSADTAPNASEVKAGHRSGGSAASSTNAPGGTNVTASPFTAGATGLTASTSYKVYFMQEDAATNQSNVAGSSTFTTGSGFTGAGDVVSGARAWWGLRAYSSADRGNNLINLCNPADSTCIDVASDGTTGNLVAPTNVGGTDCTAVNTCTIKKFYDRSGNNFCSSAACDATQNTAANRATLTWSCINSLPCAVFNGTSAYYTSAVYGNPTVNQPFTVTTVVKRTAAGGTTGRLIVWCASGCENGAGNSLSAISSSSTANTISYFVGSGGSVGSITEGNYHALVSVINSTSSTLVCSGSAGANCSTGSGTANAVSLGSTGISNNNNGTGGYFTLAANSAGSITLFCGCQFTEWGFWTAAFNSTQYGDMANNMYSHWGAF